jgi:hypothetical protein
MIGKLEGGGTQTCSAALRTRSLADSISARDFAMSAMTDPKSYDIRIEEKTGQVKRTMFIEVFPKGLAAWISYALQHQVQGCLGSTNRTHTVVNTARPVPKI